MSEHECVFMEEETPAGTLLLGPCLQCGLTAMDAMKEGKAQLTAAQQRDLTWTSEKPTQAGWYWLKYPASQRIGVVKVVDWRGDGVLYAKEDGGLDEVGGLGGEWAGPLSVPPNIQPSRGEQHG